MPQQSALLIPRKCPSVQEIKVFLELCYNTFVDSSLEPKIFQAVSTTIEVIAYAASNSVAVLAARLIIQLINKSIGCVELTQCFPYWSVFCSVKLRQLFSIPELDEILLRHRGYDCG
jgi:hypothetical protein